MRGGALPVARRSELARPHGPDRLRCVACAHRCALAPGGRGVCLMRQRDGDALLVPWGYTAGMAIDPIEKKPFFHLLPGARALSFGMLGCNFHCSFCQNWTSSQVARDPQAEPRARLVRPDELVAAAVSHGCHVITSTYNEPLISAEWSFDVFSLAREAGLVTSFVSNGHATTEVLEFITPVLDAMKVDLKAFNPATYAALGGSLAAVQETIRGLWARNVWVEVVTLVIPGFNDSDQELGSIAAFLAEISPDIPWHVTAFHPDYELTDRPPTPPASLVRAVELGRAQGLRFVYAGNLPGRTGDLEDTRCPACETTLVRRFGFVVRENRLTPDGLCPTCGVPIPGRFSLRSREPATRDGG
ncbi:MAG: AmmeMemoRadiSam system radical SAM enzyme [Thermoanaerobaculaceae bacterium]|nr:AmmeMemoRadiSam system radical SAM enzyme [Thermoanaerobaculaceae bacterium]MDI9621520.1 AmmeMemoRadiSam system radical SAM enzyme [Acidobacteriota bacterium]NLH11513.1 AmmeMemoRadiSam system radical SAM enzyme [Holophagae bacterium]